VPRHGGRLCACVVRESTSMISSSRVLCGTDEMAGNGLRPYRLSPLPLELLRLLPPPASTTTLDAAGCCPMHLRPRLPSLTYICHLAPNLPPGSWQPERCRPCLEAAVSRLRPFRMVPSLPTGLGSCGVRSRGCVLGRRCLWLWLRPWTLPCGNHSLPPPTSTDLDVSRCR
jgi:hypothetical protein